MRGLKRFFLLRKQNDRVKLVCLFSLIAIVSFVCSMVHLIRYAKLMTVPVECVAEDMLGVISDTRKRAVEESEIITCVTRNLPREITFKDQTMEIQMSGYGLEQAYIEQVYKVQISSSMPLFFANESAYTQITQGLNMPPSNCQDELRVAYCDSLEGDFRTAKIICVDTLQEEPYLFFAMDTHILKQNATQLRLQLKKQSDRDMVSHFLQGLSFSEQANSAIEIQKNEMDVLLLKLRYEWIIFFICVLSAATLWKSVRK